MVLAGFGARLCMYMRHVRDLAEKSHFEDAKGLASSLPANFSRANDSPGLHSFDPSSARCVFCVDCLNLNETALHRVHLISRVQSSMSKMPRVMQTSMSFGS